MRNKMRKKMAARLVAVATVVVMAVVAVVGINWRPEVADKTVYDGQGIISAPAETGVPATDTAIPATEETTATTVASGGVTTGSYTALATGLQQGWVHTYNSYIQNDGLSNDFNFGPDPLNDSGDPYYYDSVLRERMKWDTALAAAVMAWLDANVGTRFIGEFYDSCKGDWAKTINAAKDRFSADQMKYYKTLYAFFDYLNSARNIVIRECHAVTDQMYMNPYTASGVPDVIVMETDDHDGYQLVYSFVIKETTTIEVAFRINCGFQPTNVAEKLQVVPQKEAPQPQIVVSQPQTTPQPSGGGSPQSSDNGAPLPSITQPSAPQPSGGTPQPSTPQPSGGGNEKPETDAPETDELETAQSETTVPTISLDDEAEVPTISVDEEPEAPVIIIETEVPETDVSLPTPETSTPIPTPVPETDEPTPTPQTETNAPLPTPETDPLPVKDPTQATEANLERNDNPGPGPDTSNGVGAMTSAVDSTSSSAQYSSYDEYAQTISELEKINSEQSVGGDSNTPSVVQGATPSEPVFVDSNASNDGGNGTIDDPTNHPDVGIINNQPVGTADGFLPELND